ncbi:MAG: hypothetical protein ACRCZF_27595, partial [Gemmataceae bacterium]
AGFTHAVWIPDSTLGRWEESILLAGLPLLRPCREGEAIGIAAGLLIGEARPLVLMQCTGFFEAGDALRNVVYDMQLPLKLLVGVRSWNAAQRGPVTDNCPRFTEPVLAAWNVPYEWAAGPESLAPWANQPGPGVLLWPE